MKFIKTGWKLLRHTATAFAHDNAFKLSASLSYYTLFALGPVLIIMISFAGIFFGPDAVRGEVYKDLNDVIGGEAALQIQNIIASATRTHATRLGAIIGFIILIIGSTTVFTEMQGSINFIWSVKAKPKKGWLKYLINRGISFSLIVGLSFLLLLTLIANTLLALLADKANRLFSDYTVYLITLINNLGFFVVITILFTVIFKVLPDAIISWKDAIIGSLFTAALFFLGKYLIELYITKSKLGSTYGAAASIVILLSWVYYSSLILYFGAEFTKIYALHSGEGIRPKSTAVFIIKQESREVHHSFLES